MSCERSSTDLAHGGGQVGIESGQRRSRAERQFQVARVIGREMELPAQRHDGFLPVRDFGIVRQDGQLREALALAGSDQDKPLFQLHIYSEICPSSGLRWPFWGLLLPLQAQSRHRAHLETAVGSLPGSGDLQILRRRFFGVKTGF